MATVPIRPALRTDAGHVDADLGARQAGNPTQRRGHEGPGRRPRRREGHRDARPRGRQRQKRQGEGTVPDCWGGDGALGPPRRRRLHVESAGGQPARQGAARGQRSEAIVQEVPESGWVATGYNVARRSHHMHNREGVERGGGGRGRGRRGAAHENDAHGRLKRRRGEGQRRRGEGQLGQRRRCHVPACEEERERGSSEGSSDRQLSKLRRLRQQQ